MSELRRVKRPNRIAYWILGGIVTLYAIAVKRHKLSSKLPGWVKPPFILIGNHSSFLDFIYAIRAFYPDRLNFVVARKYFHFPPLKWILRLSHSIPKSLFQADIGTIGAMFSILKQGGIVGVYPEGQIACHGISLDNGEAMAKFIKKAGVPVVRILTGGSYFCDPPWAQSPRKGFLESRVNLVLSAAQTAELEVGEIDRLVRESIYMDCFEWQKAGGWKYKGNNLACGLENMFYICPECKKEFTIRTHEDKIFCESCGAEAVFGEDGHLHWQEKGFFPHIGSWWLWQVEQEKMGIARNEVYSVSEPVELAMLRPAGSGIEPVGNGVITVTRDHWTYEGSLRGEAVRLEFLTSVIRYLPFDAGHNFQIYHGNLLYEFRPVNPKWCAKAACICEGLRYALDKNDIMCYYQIN